MSKNSVMNTYGRFDVTFEKGFGSRLYDVNGKEYIDFVSGVAVNCLGHSHPTIINAITEQSKKLIHISNYYWNTKHTELADKLIKNCDHSKVFFCNSGTEAVEGALKVARKYGKLKGGINKNIILYMNNSFHGRSMGALSVTGQEKYQKDFMPLIGGVKRVEFNNIEDLKRSFDENVCGIIIEPIQGEGGIIRASDEFLKEARDLCNKHDALLIFDEIQCGIGRLGSLFAYKEFGVVPDVITIAKGLGGGFPIGAFIVNEKAENVLVPGDHGSTFGGNPLACAVGIAVLNELIEGGIVASVKKKGQYLKEKLSALKEKYKVINEIKGMGLLLGISVDDPKAFMNACFKKGLLVVTAGEDVVRILPPLNVTKEDMNAALNILEDIMKEMHV
ncbi:MULTISPECIES: aspartate aminotransferase family protein [Clostridium]|jgi:acetylornithine/N-succinyldiaminopimelate aminotransferase|uniref:Acetylornithine aminotransferase n=2 Tax=Clostridium TaxID=1485 RepID=A0A151AL67_9CLOT|nr:MULTISPECIES: aspartate aminotransferase family protein [Clostridium]KYH28355.1 acetylornithine aminotransferase [Clostridium colicanis DSM 13634]MBE6043588.1 aspartate aminotransferase family protein [Clostridium thermopalmarium]PRR68797.1 Acetylornithine aminotransferase [Clostridium thermopalmarium DSM 5974]PVZ22620.1 acetylornithine/N-succinyldiaminopimelate aminotransferase [Clostridium thermopalmarium DSM 5974]